MMRVEIFSFFSGLGFMDLGFEGAGFSIAFVNEFNKQFLSAYKYARRGQNLTPKYGYSSHSIVEYLDDAIWENTFVDYDNRNNRLIGFIGGPPCPDFSVAGKNEGKDGENGQLTNVYVNLIIKRQPDFFVLENVKGLYKTKKHKAFYEILKRRLNRKGYTLFDSVENALEYGAPQYRERLVLVGLKRDTFGKGIQFLIGGHKCFKLNDILNLPWPNQTPFIENGDIPFPNGILSELTVEHWFRANDVVNHANAKDVFAVKNNERFQKIEEGDTNKKSFKRLHRWRYSPTVAYGNNEVHLHPYKLRRISVAEALALQTMPRYFEIREDIPLSSKFKMVGNGVPYLLAHGIAKDIHEWIEKYLHKIGDTYD